jgi:hypothetical protein
MQVTLLLGNLEECITPSVYDLTTALPVFTGPTAIQDAINSVNVLNGDTLAVDDDEVYNGFTIPAGRQLTIRALDYSDNSVPLDGSPSWVRRPYTFTISRPCPRSRNGRVTTSSTARSAVGSAPTLSKAASAPGKWAMSCG